MLDIERAQRLGSYIAIGVATQVSREFMQADDLSKSFWLLILVTFVMISLQTLFHALGQAGTYLTKCTEDTKKNWTPWIVTLQQTISGLETVAWTIYGNAIGTFVLLIYLDMREVPKFLYFFPFYVFLLGYFAVNQNTIRSYSLKSQLE